MSQLVNISDAVANAQANALAALFNGGLISYYTGPQPATANTALSGPNNFLMAAARLANPAFGSAVGGVLTANAIPAASSAAGVCTFARITGSTGITMDVAVGLPGSGAAIILSSVAINAGQTISLTSFSYNVVE